MAFYRQSLRILNRYVAPSIKSLSVLEPRYIKRWVSPTLRELHRRKQKVGPLPPQHRSTYLEWNYDAEIFAFGKRLGEEFNDQILRQALTHQSYVIEQITKQNQDNATQATDNKELITKGEKLISNYLMDELKGKYPDVLVNVIIEYLMKTDMLAKVASDIGLKDLILCADFPVERATLANSFKAILAALELSSGTDRARLFVKDFLVTQLTGKDIYDDIWNLEQPFEHLKGLLGGKGIEPRLCNQSATNTILANYQVGLYSEKQLLGIGSILGYYRIKSPTDVAFIAGFGESIETAKNTAAVDAIKRIHKSILNKKYIV